MPPRLLYCISSCEAPLNFNHFCILLHLAFLLLTQLQIKRKKRKKKKLTKWLSSHFLYSYTLLIHITAITESNPASAINPIGVSAGTADGGGSWWRSCLLQGKQSPLGAQDWVSPQATCPGSIIVLLSYYGVLKFSLPVISAYIMDIKRREPLHRGIHRMISVSWIVIGVIPMAADRLHLPLSELWLYHHQMPSHSANCLSSGCSPTHQEQCNRGISLLSIICFHELDRDRFVSIQMFSSSFTNCGIAMLNP